MERLNVLSALILCHPTILPDVEQAYAQLELPESLDHMRAVILEWADQCETLSFDTCQSWMAEHGWGEQFLSLITGPLPRHSRVTGQSDEILKVDVLESWWHFYGLVNFASFEREVQRSVQDAIMQAYTRPSDSGNEERFPEHVLARMRVLEALKRGEKPELDDGINTPP